MKKILTLATMVGLAFGANAQRTANVSAHLATPAETAELTLHCTDSIAVAYYFINEGPDDVLTTDTMTFYDAQTNPYKSTFRVIPTTVKHVGDTLFKNGGYYKFSDVEFLWDATDGSVDTTRPFNGAYLFPILFGGYGWSAVSDQVGQDADPPTDQASFKLTMSCVTGIKGLTKNNSTLNVYPNPANNQISFTNQFATATTASVRITDIAGRVVKTMDLGKQNAGSKTYNVDIADLHNGMYYIELVTEDSRSISKFIKN